MSDHTTHRGHLLRLGGPADCEGDGVFRRPSGRHHEIVDLTTLPEWGGLPRFEPVLVYTFWGPSDARFMADYEEIRVDDPDDYLETR